MQSQKEAKTLAGLVYRWWAPMAISAICAALMVPSAVNGDSLGVVFASSLTVTAVLFAGGVGLSLGLIAIPWIRKRAMPGWAPNACAVCVVVIAGLAVAGDRHSDCRRYAELMRQSQGFEGNVFAEIASNRDCAPALFRRPRMAGR